MSKNIRKYIHLIYGIALSAVTVIAGIRFILACYHIYTTGKAGGGQIYSRAAVAEAFAPMAISVYLCLALVIGGFLLHLIFPPEKKKLSPEKNRHLILQRLRSKTNLELIDPDTYRTIARLNMGRLVHIVISIALLVIFSIVFLIYACSPSRWPEVANVTTAMVQAVFVLLLCLIAPTGYAIFAAYFCRRSMDREIEIMKDAAKQAPREVPSPAPAPRKCRCLAAIRCVILAAAVAFIIVGYCAGGIADVVAKAAAICTECVGLG